MSQEPTPLPDDQKALPPGWEYQPLARLVDQNRGICYGIVQPGSHTAAGVPIVRVNNIKDGRIDTSDMLRVAEEIESKYGRSRLRGGEVLLTLVGSLGESAIVPPELAGWNVARAVGVLPVTPEIGPRWVELCLRSPAIQHFIGTRATTTVQATFNLRDVATLPIPIPPRQEREAIAEFLGALDDKTDLNRRMNETLEGSAYALFKQRFIDPAQDGLPKGWREGTIKDCCSQIQNGGTPRRDEPRYWNSGTIPWLTSGEVRQPIVTQTENFITEAGLNESSAKWVAPLSTVVALYGATSGQVSLVSYRLTTNQAVCALIPKPNFEFFNYLAMRTATPELEKKAVGSAQQNISKAIVEETPIALPPEEDIEHFTSIVRPLFDKWIHNLHESRTLAELRDTLLPKLLSGEVRLTT